MRSLYLVLAFLIVPAAACGQRAPAEPWVVFYQRGQVIASVDTSRMGRAGSGHELWLRFDASPNQVPGEPEKTYTHSEILQRLDCAADSVNSYRLLMWDPAGTLVDEVTTESGWRKMSEHPLGQSGIYPALCRWLARRE